MRTSRIGRLRGQKGALAAGAVVAIAAGVAGVGVAGAEEQDTTIGVVNNAAWDKTDVTVQTGESVTWSFAGAQGHNVASSNEVAEDSNWAPFVEPGEFQAAPEGATYSYRFTKPGDYRFICEFHEVGMAGTIHVNGDPIETPTPDPTQTATPTPTPTPTPTVSPVPQPGGGNTTPPPGSGTDSVKPRVSSVKLKALRRGAQIRFKLSENATVTIVLRKRGARKILKAVHRQVRAGMRTVTVRSSRLKKGRYTVEVRARDAFGNRSTLARKSLTLRR
jgi:plastocyanin